MEGLGKYDKGVHTSPKRVNPKVNIIARLEIELTYLEFGGEDVNHNETLQKDIFYEIYQK